jgi:hypothetical protein
MSRDHLARRQADLVGALVSGQPTPPGFDQTRVRAATAALLRKRAGEVAAAWSALRTELGPQWMTVFEAYAAARAPRSALRDGWDLARLRRATLGHAARLELAQREATWRYNGRSEPRRRRAPAVRRAGRAFVVQVLGHVHTWPRRP